RGLRDRRADRPCRVPRGPGRLRVRRGDRTHRRTPLARTASCDGALSRDRHQPDDGGARPAAPGAVGRPGPGRSVGRLAPHPSSGWGVRSVPVHVRARPTERRGHRARPAGSSSAAVTRRTALSRQCDARPNAAGAGSDGRCREAARILSEPGRWMPRHPRAVLPRAWPLARDAPERGQQVGNPVGGAGGEAGARAIMTTVLFACLHNAGRSQMAAAFFNVWAHPAKAHAISAGTQPADHVHPEVVAAMQEIGIKFAGTMPQRLTEELARTAGLLVTMGCEEKCPVVPGLRREDWDLPAPQGPPFEPGPEIPDTTL